MVTLPQLGNYTSGEIKELEAYSPAFTRYRNLLQREPKSFADQIRVEKHRAWLDCVAATYFSKSSPEDICRFWSQHTDTVLQKSWNHVDLGESGLSLLAFGKLGSYELNLSSDIDVVFVRDENLESTSMTPKVKKFIQLLSQQTVFAFAYRVDLNLRPGGPASPMVPTKPHFYNFYDEFSEAWHRLSFIRMRPLLGDKKLGDDLYQYGQRMAYPRRLDFSVVEEIKNIRSKINYQWRKAHEPFDIKLCPGGIRDIELLVHSLQVIYGGKEIALQQPHITQSLKTLSANGAIKKEDYNFLIDFYWRLRKIENLIHGKEDQHTYLLDTDWMESCPALNETKDSLIAKLKTTESIVDDFFAPLERQHTETPNGALSESAEKALADIKRLNSPALKKTKTEEAKSRIIDQFVSYSQKISIDEDLAIQIFRDFIYAIKSKSSIFHVLDRNETLVENLAWLFSLSPYVGQILSRRPELIDSFVLGHVTVEHEDTEIFLENLMDYKLLGQLASITYLLKDKDIEKYCLSISEIADSIFEKLLARLVKDAQCDPIEVLCMGKWSGFELGAHSDLDFVFLTASSPTEGQVRVARRMINHLTAHSKAGKLYNIDLRLKPNENAGPLLLEKSRLEKFIKEEAEPWQKQAYLKSRLLGTKNFFLQKHFPLLQLNQEEIVELNKVHEKVYQSLGTTSLDVKLSLGGIVHSEFVLQKKCLLQTQPPQLPSTHGIIETLGLEQNHKEDLLHNYLFLRQFEQLFQICNESPRTKVVAESPTINRLNKVLDLDDSFAQLHDQMEKQVQKLNSLDLTR